MVIASSSIDGVVVIVTSFDGDGAMIRVGGAWNPSDEESNDSGQANKTLPYFHC